MNSSPHRGEGSCNPRIKLQGSAKRWALGCVNPASWLSLAAEREFTQPRDHYFAQPCIVQPCRNASATKFKWRESLAEKLRFPVTKVILLSSNPRSGSSFLGDVLTPAPVAASYFYEPLRYLYESVPRSQADRG